MSALGTRLAVCLVWTLALVVPTVECFGKTLQLLKPSTSPTGSSEAPTLAPQMTQCAKHVLNDGKCDHTCADCADCALSSGEYKPCDDACPNHTKTEDCNPQLWSPAWRTVNRSDTCQVGVGHSAMRHPDADPDAEGTNRNPGLLDMLLGAEGNGALNELSQLQEYFGLTVSLPQLPDICADMFEEYGRSLEEAALKTHSTYAKDTETQQHKYIEEASQQGHGTICNRRFPMWDGNSKKGRLCTPKKPCNLVQLQEKTLTEVLSSQTAQCYNHSKYKTAPDNKRSYWGPNKIFEGVLTCCATVCMNDKKQQCCDIPASIRWMFPTCTNCNKAGRRRMQGAAGAGTSLSITVEAGQRQANVYNELTQCLRSNADMAECLAKPTPKPTKKPTRAPTKKPTKKPTTKKPTNKPTTKKPTKKPTVASHR